MIDYLFLLQDNVSKTRELERELRALTIEKTRAENLLEVQFMSLLVKEDILATLWDTFIPDLFLYFLYLVTYLLSVMVHGIGDNVYFLVISILSPS